VQIYQKPLEKVEPFNNFIDFCNTFSLTHGKSTEEDEQEIVGEFKVKEFPTTVNC